MSDFNKASFIGGLNRLYDPTRIGPEEYAFLTNGRTRKDVVVPIQKPTEITAGLPEGKRQGMYVSGSITVVFVAGAAYYRLNQTSDFQVIRGFKMNAEVDKIYTAFVPAATVTGIRELVKDVTSNKYLINGGINIFTNGTGSLSCLVCQDGINRPWVIFPDGTARETQVYADWQRNGEREYVPIGTDMMYYNGILYILSPDRLEIYHSVTGRPLDFVIAIQSDGDKLPTEAEGGASAVSWKVSYDPISCIKPLAVQDGSFYVSTKTKSVMVTPLTDDANKVYGEPTFKNTDLFDVGSYNNQSFVEMLGDSAFITHSGVRSFNAVMQTKFEGKNSPFSATVQNLFDGIQQNQPCCIFFDNYVYFSVNTVYGYVVLVYDTIVQKFVSIDKYTGVDQIISFGMYINDTVKELYAFTESGKIFHLFSAVGFETCGVYIGDFKSEDLKAELKLNRIRLAFTDVTTSGIIYATVYIDGVKKSSFSQNLNISNTQQTLPLTLPLGSFVDDSVQNPSIAVSTVQASWKIGVYVEWQFNAKLAAALVEATDVQGNATYSQAAVVHKAIIDGMPKIDRLEYVEALIPTSVIIVKGSNFQNVIACGFNSSTGTVYATHQVINSANQLTIAVPDGAITGYLKLKTKDYTVESSQVLEITPSNIAQNSFTMVSPEGEGVLVEFTGTQFNFSKLGILDEEAKSKALTHFYMVDKADTSKYVKIMWDGLQFDFTTFNK